MKRRLNQVLRKEQGTMKKVSKAFEMNIKYSRVWMAVTGKDVHAYRQYSIIHKLLVMMY